RRCSHCH
ncbi:exonuclease family domain protein, partial [Escherichia coli EC1869]